MFELLREELYEGPSSLPKADLLLRMIMNHKDKDHWYDWPIIIGIVAIITGLCAWFSDFICSITDCT